MKCWRETIWNSRKHFGKNIDEPGLYGDTAAWESIWNKEREKKRVIPSCVRLFGLREHLFRVRDYDNVLASIRALDFWREPQYGATNK